MLITERPYGIQRMKDLPNVDRIFLEPLDQKSMKETEKRVVFLHTTGVDNSSVEMYSEQLGEGLMKCIQSAQMKLKVFWGEIPVAYPAERVTSLKQVWKTNGHLILNPQTPVRALLDVELFKEYKDMGFRITIWTQLLKMMNRLSKDDQLSEGQLQTLFYKFVYWLQEHLGTFYSSELPKVRYHQPKKLVYIGIPKPHEGLLLQLILQLGVDVWVIDAENEWTYDTWNEALKPECVHYDHTGPLILKNIEKKMQEAVLAPPVKMPEKEEYSQEDVQDENIEQTYEQLAELGQSVVLIQVYGPGDEVVGRGSGVIIDSGGLIVTNVHVVIKGLRYGIRFENTNEEMMTDYVYYMDALNDLAFLKIDKPCRALKTTAKDELKRGQEIVTIGSPLGLMNTISNGIVSGFRCLDGVRFIQITAPISHGSSGGALLDKFGRLVGITSAGFAEGQNLNLAVPVVEINRILNQGWIAKGENLKSLMPQLVINGIQFVPRLSEDDNKDRVVLLYPLAKDYHAYYRTCMNRGSNCFDKNVAGILGEVLKKSGIDDFDYYFLPVGEKDES